MATPIKFTEEELKQVTELRDASQAKVVEFGQLKLERILTENRLTQLDQLDEEAKNSYIELQKQEADLVGQLKEKYGAGTVDVESGEFVPAK
jgi:adenylate kinase